MKRNYEILVTASATILVIGAESPQKAFEYAQDELSTGCFRVESMHMGRTIPNDEIDVAIDSADAVAEYSDTDGEQ